MARLHAAPIAKAPALSGPEGEAPTSYSIMLTRLAMTELLQPSPALRLVLHWLERNEPAESPECVVHSDFRNGNIIVGPDGLRASLDWEVCRRGDPMEDPAWMCVRMWRFRNDTLEVGGFGRLEDLRAGYEEAGGSWDQERFHWWKVLGTVSWGLGLAKQGREHLDGTLRSIVLAASGRRVAELEYDALMLLRGQLGA
jgi:aminoglycoside phosphotransferase (APT) family kinase protein